MSLARILAQKNAAKKDGRTASKATRKKRADVLYAGFDALRELGYRLDDAHSFRNTHMQVLARHWEKEGLSPSVIVNHISIFRLFAEWIDKPGMIGPAERYVESRDSVLRTSVNKEDKSWAAKGVDVAEKIAEVRAIDERTAIMLELQWRFGLRMEESVCFRPHHDDQGAYIRVIENPKGGLPRDVPVGTDEQRDLLTRAKAIARLNESIADPRWSLPQAEAAYHRVAAQAGITRENGITSHGLRHQFAIEMYERLSGAIAPVRGGTMPRDVERYHFARQQLAFALGHRREGIVTHYIGSYYVALRKAK